MIGGLIRLYILSKLVNIPQQTINKNTNHKETVYANNDQHLFLYLIYHIVLNN